MFFKVEKLMKKNKFELDFLKYIYRYSATYIFIFRNNTQLTTVSMLRKVTSCSELKNIFYRKAVACAASVIFSVLNNFFQS